MNNQILPCKAIIPYTEYLTYEYTTFHVSVLAVNFIYKFMSVL